MLLPLNGKEYTAGTGTVLGETRREGPNKLETVMNSYSDEFLELRRIMSTFCLITPVSTESPVTSSSDWVEEAET